MTACETTVLVFGGGSLVLLTYELSQTSAALGLPISIVYSVIPLSGVIVTLYCVAAFSEQAGPDVAGEAD